MYISASVVHRGWDSDAFEARSVANSDTMHVALHTHRPVSSASDHCAVRGMVCIGAGRARKGGTLSEEGYRHLAILLSDSALAVETQAQPDLPALSGNCLVPERRRSRLTVSPSVRASGNPFTLPPLPQHSRQVTAGPDAVQRIIEGGLGKCYCVSEMVAAILSAKSVLLILGPEYFESEYCRLELRLALLHRSRLIPVFAVPGYGIDNVPLEFREDIRAAGLAWNLNVWHASNFKALNQMEALQDLLDYIRVPDPTRNDLATAVRLQAGVRPGLERRTSLARCAATAPPPVSASPVSPSPQRRTPTSATPTAPFTRDHFFHDVIYDKNERAALVMDAGTGDGTFLVCMHSDGSMVLVVVYKNRATHHRVSCNDGVMLLQNKQIGERASTLEELVRVLGQPGVTGWPVPLQYPVPDPRTQVVDDAALAPGWKEQFDDSTEVTDMMPATDDGDEALRAGSIVAPTPDYDGAPSVSPDGYSLGAVEEQISEEHDDVTVAALAGEYDTPEGTAAASQKGEYAIPEGQAVAVTGGNEYDTPEHTAASALPAAGDENGYAVPEQNLSEEHTLDQSRATQGGAVIDFTMGLSAIIGESGTDGHDSPTTGTDDYYDWAEPQSPRNAAAETLHNTTARTGVGVVVWQSSAVVDVLSLSPATCCAVLTGAVRCAFR
eukprot:m.1542272 g.1542272  ORF g.1542272 m.1542272 type:complete len:667 (-) comp25255_c1_seq7:7-2007(-)